jgi:hypothetical protein
MSNSILTEKPRELDARVTSIAPVEPQADADAEPRSTGLRIAFAEESDEDDFRHARLVIAAYVQKYGAARVLEAVRQLAGGAR